MSEKYAIFIDGAFLRNKLESKLRKRATAEDVVKHCGFIHADPILTGVDRFRIFYYDAPPLETKITNPLDKSLLDLATTDLAKQNKAMIETLELQPFFAVRTGMLLFHGWKLRKSFINNLGSKSASTISPSDIQPDINQKCVDIKIGLDIAWISTKRIVDIVILVTGDTDFIPAMKFARKEGIKVYLNSFDDSIRRELRVHSDFVIRTEYK